MEQYGARDISEEPMLKKEGGKNQEITRKVQSKEGAGLQSAINKI
jgi:hypothetical protein